MIAEKRPFVSRGGGVCTVHKAHCCYKLECSFKCYGLIYTRLKSQYYIWVKEVTY